MMKRRHPFFFALPVARLSSARLPRLHARAARRGPALVPALPLAALFLAALSLTACNLSLAADVTPPPGYRPPAVLAETQAVSGPLFPPMPPNPADGEPIYAEKCAPCHGPQGLGDGEQADALPNRPSALGDPALAREKTPAEWYAVVTNGNMERMMPPFNSLSDRERWDVAAYSLSLSIPGSQIEAGREIYAANCASCHGEQGMGDGPQAASLETQPAALANPEFMASRSTASFFETVSNGTPGGHPAFAGDLSEDERWAVSDYVRWISFAGGQTDLAVSAGLGSGTPSPEPESTEEAESATPPSGEDPAAGTAAPEGPALGVVRGQVTNASGGGLPGGAQVTLHGFDEMQLATTLTTTVGSEGSFIFEQVAMPEGRVFLVTLEYQGATYGSDVATVQPGSNEVELPVTVYETTSDTSALTVDRLHLFLEFLDEQTVRVIELYIVSNPTQQTIVAPAEGEPVLAYSLPEGAANLQFQEGALGERFVETPQGFGDTLAIRPGSGVYQVLFAYELPYDGRLELTHPVQLPVSALVVLAPEGGLNIKGENLQDAGVRPVEGASYHMYNGGSLAAGDSLELTITGKAGGSGVPALSTGSTTNLLIGAGVFGLVLVGAGLWLYRRNRTEEEEEPEEEDLPEAPLQEEDPEVLMDAILALDDRFQAGELPEGAYRQRRSDLKARLLEAQRGGGQDRPAE